MYLATSDMTLHSSLARDFPQYMAAWPSRPGRQLVNRKWVECLDHNHHSIVFTLFIFLFLLFWARKDYTKENLGSLKPAKRICPLHFLSFLDILGTGLGYFLDWNIIKAVHKCCILYLSLSNKKYTFTRRHNEFNEDCDPGWKPSRLKL